MEKKKFGGKPPTLKLPGGKAKKLDTSLNRLLGVLINKVCCSSSGLAYFIEAPVADSNAVGLVARGGDVVLRHDIVADQAVADADVPAVGSSRSDKRVLWHSELIMKEQ
jgi:hypothetical protein